MSLVPQEGKEGGLQSGEDRPFSLRCAGKRSL